MRVHRCLRIAAAGASRYVKTAACNVCYFSYDYRKEWLYLSQAWVQDPVVQDQDPDRKWRFSVEIHVVLRLPSGTNADHYEIVERARQRETERESGLTWSCCCEPVSLAVSCCCRSIRSCSALLALRSAALLSWY